MAPACKNRGTGGSPGLGRVYRTPREIVLSASSPSPSLQRPAGRHTLTASHPDAARASISRAARGEGAEQRMPQARSPGCCGYPEHNCKAWIVQEGRQRCRILQVTGCKAKSRPSREKLPPPWWQTWCPKRVCSPSEPRFPPSPPDRVGFCRSSLARSRLQSRRIPNVHGQMGAVQEPFAAHASRILILVICLAALASRESGRGGGGDGAARYCTTNSARLSSEAPL
jgi:hypothetical protein